MEHTDPNKDNLIWYINEKLNTFHCPAPKELWDGIAHDLDIDSDNIDNHLKDAAGNVQSIAPAFLWNSIEEQLHGFEAANDDKILDDKIKSSYHINAKAPETFWYGIEQQLNIDKIWENMTPELNTLRSRYVWRKRLQYLSIAAMLLLLIRGCSFDSWMPEFGQQTARLEWKKQNERTQKSADRLNSFDNNSQLNTSEDTHNQNFANFDRYNNHVRLQGKIKKTAEKFFSPLNDKFFEFNLKKIIGKHNFTGVTSFDSSLTNDQNIILSSNSLETKVADLTDHTDYEFGSAPLFSEMKKKLKISKIISYEIGLIGLVNQAVFVNDFNTKKLSSFSKTPVRSYSPLTFSYGLQVGLNFAKNHSLIAELWFSSKIRKVYSYSFNGRNITDEIDLEYVKMSISYRPSILRYGRSKNNKIIATLGVYLSNLQQLSRNNLLQFRPIAIPEIHSWDSGVLVAFGQQHSISKSITFEYGVRSEIGFAGIFDLPKSNRYFNSSNIFGVGGYAALRYKF